MKYLFTFLLLFTVVSAQAQYFINFETNNASIVPYQNFISIDTINYARNEWQVGHPNKVAFNAAYSIPNVIVTDTLLACVPNDTSVFILKVPNLAGSLEIDLTFLYKLDMDSNDIAMVEMSSDTGSHWANIDSFNLIYFPYGNPNLTVSTNGWDTAFIDLLDPYSYPRTDSFQFRFTYITDSSSAPRDGWMIDNIWMGYQSEGIKNINQNVFVNASPNPANRILTVKHTLSQSVTMNVALMNSIGQLMYTTERKNISSSDGIPIDVSGMPDGMYFCSVTVDGQKITKQVTVLH